MSPTWHTPRTWIASESVMPWHFRTFLRDNVRILRKRQEASAGVVTNAGNNIQARSENETALSFDNARWNYGAIAGAPGSERITKFVAPLTGLYELWFVVEWAADSEASGIRSARWLVNGSSSNIPNFTCEPGGNTDDRTDQHGYWLCLLNAGDEVELQIQHTSTASEIEIETGERNTRAGINFIGETADSPTSWTTPASWVAGNVPTETDFNTQIRDNLLNLRQCRGVLSIAKLTATETITINTLTAIPWDQTVVNMGGAWSIAAPTRFTAPVTGWYQVSGFFRWAAGPSGNRRVDVRVNGTQLYRGHTSSRVSDDSRGAAWSVYLELPLTATNYVEFVAHNTNEVGFAWLRPRPTYGSLMLLGD